jgi:hypothetical protein
MTNPTPVPKEECVKTIDLEELTLKYGSHDSPEDGMCLMEAPDAERFWAKVQKSPTCWHWVGGRDPKGYERERRREVSR